MEQIIYGKNPVFEALRGRRQVKRLLVERSLSVQLSDLCRSVEIEVLSASELERLAGTKEHQGICAVVDSYPYLEGEELMQQCDLVVALDRVHDPQNLGAIIRSCECAGAGVVIPRHRSAEITPAVVKASAGATEHCLVARVRNLADLLDQAKQLGFWVYGADSHAPEVYCDQDYRHDKVCFVLGSEGFGLGQRVASKCDVLIRVPLMGKICSLNVSVTAGILLYEARRQRSFSHGNLSY